MHTEEAMPRRAKNKDPKMYWRNGRAYGDFRAFEKVGGGREALAQQGETWGTTDEEIARALFSRRLNELQQMSRRRAGAAPGSSTTLAWLASEHLKLKWKAKKTSESHMRDLEHRLRTAIDFFGHGRDPNTIRAKDVGSWADALAKDGERKPGTVRHYLNALSGLYERADELEYVDDGYNPVAKLKDNPVGKWRGDEAKFFEVDEAALLLEAARVLERPGETSRVGARGNRVTANPGLYPIIGTFLLTGGRFSEVLGLDVEDVRLDRGIVRFRPNAHRGLKTSTSIRTVPLWPQLRGILQKWMYGGEQPRTEGLLFPSTTGGRIQDLRKSLDAMGALCGMEPGEVRTKAFRHTHCSARLQTVQGLLKPGRAPTDPDAFEYVEVSRFTVQKEMGHGGAQLVDRIYGHPPMRPHRSDEVEFRVEKHQEALGERLTALTAGA